ncbi:MAG: hypothetical protein R3F17_01455 [Planctomycetota bacterium]
MNALHPRSRIRQGRLFLLSLRVAAARVSIWAGIAGLFALGGLALARPWSQFFGGIDGHRYEAHEQFASLDVVFRHDQSAALSQLGQSTAQSAVVLALIAWLLGIFVAGGWLQVIAERAQTQVLRRFCAGGARHFLRFLRLSLLLLVALGLVRWLLYGPPFESLVLRKLLGLPATDLLPGRQMESIGSEATRDRVLWLRDGLMALSFLYLMALGYYARARMAVLSKRSAWAALGWAFGATLRAPLRTLGPLTGILLVELFVLTAILGPVSRWLNGRLAGGANLTTVWVLAGIGLLALVLREIARGARYHTALVVTKANIRSHVHPDPWQTIGAPGGPQYPVQQDGDERYGVSV